VAADTLLLLFYGLGLGIPFVAAAWQPIARCAGVKASISNWG